MEQAGKSRRGDRDMISSLPDCLIHLIMSFLTAQQAVRTCVLSKRWKHLWTTLPFLDFDVLKFECDGESEGGDPQSIKLEKFRDFVSMTLLLREASDVHTFRLFCFGISPLPKCHMFVRSWIAYALKHNVQVFKFDYDCDHHLLLLPSSLPLGFFNCASLVDASITYIFPLLNIINVINLPCLRRLYLEDIYLDQDVVDKLLCGCPVLELLHLKDCDREYSTINSQNLKYLVVEDRVSYLETEREMELINTPNLLSFRYTTNIKSFGPKMFLKVPSLTSAYVCINDMSWEGSKSCFKGKSNILIGLSNVQNLKLSGSMLKDLLEKELSNCPEFSNLKDLSVDELCLSCHFNLLASFLNRCPYLEKLSLKDAVYCKSQMHGIQELLKIAPFNGKRLTTVEFKFYKREKSFPQVVKYLQDITENSRAQINVTSISFRY
ncbi:F-box/RNI-like superfamily protein [Rhynchospora pubera]|uniref:F-box/RNI-like superfamily protein n=1 Tax=Rhynchospora pubera TaxID=906938 RepID=A0AAV8H1D8_9POAL|nr:F-box/RNI-like superfamily protein [Rhynchospora pubera]